MMLERAAENHHERQSAFPEFLSQQNEAKSACARLKDYVLSISPGCCRGRSAPCSSAISAPRGSRSSDGSKATTQERARLPIKATKRPIYCQSTATRKALRSI